MERLVKIEHHEINGVKVKQRYYTGKFEGFYVVWKVRRERIGNSVRMKDPYIVFSGSKEDVEGYVREL